MFDESGQERTFVVRLNEPTFCSSIFTSLSTATHGLQQHVSSREGWRQASVATIGGSSTIDDDVAMEDVPSTNITTCDRLDSDHNFVFQSQDCVAVTSTRMQHGSTDYAESVSQQLMTTALQIRTQHVLPANHAFLDSLELAHQQVSVEQLESRPVWAQIIDGVPQAAPGLPYSTARIDRDGDEPHLHSSVSASVTTEFNAQMSTQLTQHDAIPVDDPARFHDVADFMHEFALMHASSEALDLIAGIYKTRTVDRYWSNLWPWTCADPQGVYWPSHGASRSVAIALREMTDPRRQKRNPGPDLASNIYSFHSYHPQHLAHCCHYQLRNLLTATSRADVFYACGTTVKAASLAVPSVKRTVMDFERPSTTAMPFRVTCLGSSPQTHRGYASQNCLVAGGFNGEYAVLNLGSEIGTEAHEGLVSHAYDGLVTHIDTFRHRRSGGVHATFSTNDCQIRVMDLATETVVLDLKYNHAVNASCTSPDGRLRLLVGDHDEALMADAESGLALMRLDGSGSESFACAWSQDSRHFATASSSGAVVLWDARMLDKPASMLHCDRGARSLHFTDDNHLVIAEDHDSVNFYDVNRNVQQDCSLFGSIAGVAVLDGGDEIVVANSDRTVGGLLVLKRDRKLRGEHCSAAGVQGSYRGDDQYDFVI